MQRKQRLIVVGALVALFALSGFASAQTALPAAEIVNDEGGTVVLRGVLTYTSLTFAGGVAEPLVILEDQGGFVERDFSFRLPLPSQTIGQFTSDFYTSPVGYSLALPAEPQGTYHDVDNDSEADTGVQVFAVAYWSNTWGDPFLEERDLYAAPWSTAYASTRVSENADTALEIVGGQYVVYAPDDQQGFPSGFGEDGRLFTEDDPIVSIPQGYMVVNLDTAPFTFSRERVAEVDLIEPSGAALVDFSDMSYTQAFDAAIEMMRREYAFTEYKSIDWDALWQQFRPRFEQADANRDTYAYALALRDFSYAIPDGHVRVPLLLTQDFQRETAFGLGVAIRDVDDGRVIVSYLTPDGPAERAGIQQGAEIISFNGTPIDDAIEAAVPWSSPFSTEHAERLQQLRYATRFLQGSSVAVTYQNPGAAQPETVTLPAELDPQSFEFSASGVSFAAGLTGFELPVEYELLPSGYVYAKIYSFNDNSLLSIELWERMIQTLKAQQVPGVIVDMRQNGGGSGWLAAQMAAYFFNDPLVFGNTGSYDEERGEFFFHPEFESQLFPPSEEFRYHGDVAVLVGPTCASACEVFAYAMTLEDRAAIVGQYPTAGLGGGITDFLMPHDIPFRYTIARSVDAEGNINIEGIGVVPTVRVPVTEATLFSDSDPVLDAAVEYLNS